MGDSYAFLRYCKTIINFVVPEEIHMMNIQVYARLITSRSALLATENGVKMH